ncbi:MAG: TonB-dependent receptor [Bacteroidales bacterium]|nr:TonB-dependent receptor [Bacteroidales bacterium]
MEKRLPFQLALVLIAVLFTFSSALAQTGEVTGTVRDATDGSTLPGASVLIKGTTSGMITDINGKFSLQVEPNTTLIISFMGYETKEIIVEPGQTLDVELQPAAQALEELVVIGYGVQKKDDATGSVNAISSDEFNTGSISTPSQLITGKIPGVQIIDDGGAPGARSTIRIRGGSSLQAINDPLIVIDGVPVESDEISGMRNPLNVVNPNDIESISVLKDASATAIYGSRASNGVIMITTKKSSEAEQKGALPFRLTYNGKFSLSSPTRKVDVYDADEFRSLIQEKQPSHMDMLGDANTDWQDEIFQNAIGMDHYLSAAGKVGFMPFRLSFGYADKDGILKTDNFNRTTLSANLNPTFLDDHLKVNLNAKGMFVNNHFADRGAIGGAVQFDPTKPVNGDTTAYGGYYAWLQSNGQPVGQATTNPVALLELRNDESSVNRFIGNAQFDYKFHFMPELRANLNLGYDYSSSEGTIFVPTYAAFEYVPGYYVRPEGDSARLGGVDNMYEQTKENKLMEFYLNYVKDYESIDSKVDFMIGHSYQSNYRKNYSINSNVANEPAQTDTIDDPTEYVLLSYFGRLNYTFKNRYLLTFTLRNDNTSRFSEDNRQGWFPSVALGWKMHQENFMKSVDFISRLKLRASWGITGQQNINQGDYPYLSRYTLSQQNARYQLGNVFYYTLRPEGYDSKIKWEETTTWNFGLDYGFANDRYYGSIDVYYRETKDLLNEIPWPAGTNLTNILLTNIGNLENKGVEFSIYTRPVVKEDIYWEVGFNASYNHNEITKLIASDNPDYPGFKTGGISGGVGNNIQIHSVGHPAYSFYVYEQVYDENGDPIEGLYVDRNGDGQITDDDRYHYKDPNPKYVFGISSNLKYKNWDFAFSGRANFGNYVYNNVASENGVYERLYRPEGPYLSNISTTVEDTEFENPRYLSDYFIQDGSFFRMDYITLAYNFNDIINGDADLRLSFTVNNAFVITQYEGLDPEIHLGIDNNIYPRPRTFVFGANLQF